MGEEHSARTIWWWFLNQLDGYPARVGMDADDHGRHLVISGPREMPLNLLDPAKRETIREKERGKREAGQEEKLRP